MGHGDESLQAAALHHQAAFDLAEPLHLNRFIPFKQGLKLGPPTVKFAAPPAQEKLRLLAVADLDHLDLDLVARLRLLHVLDEDAVRPL